MFAKNDNKARPAPKGAEKVRRTVACAHTLGTEAGGFRAFFFARSERNLFKTQGLKQTATTRGGGRRTALLLRLGLYTSPSSRTATVAAVFWPRSERRVGGWSALA